MVDAEIGEGVTWPRIRWNCKSFIRATILVSWLCGGMMGIGQGQCSFLRSVLGIALTDSRPVEEIVADSAAISEKIGG